MGETTDKELEDLFTAYNDNEKSWSGPTLNTDGNGGIVAVKNESPVDLRFLSAATPPDNAMVVSSGHVGVEKRKSVPGGQGRSLEDQGPVWNNDMVFLLIEQYRLFKGILDDKQHAKKPVWEKIADNLIAMGCNVTPMQCSQKWRNMMLQRRTRRQKAFLGLVSTKSVSQPWEDLLEEVAPPIDPDQLASMTLPSALLVAASQQEVPRMTQYLKRRRTEEAILKSITSDNEGDGLSRGGTGEGGPGSVRSGDGGVSPQMIADAEVHASPSGSSDPEEHPPPSSSAGPPVSKQMKMEPDQLINNLAAAAAALRNTSSPTSAAGALPVVTTGFTSLSLPLTRNGANSASGCSAGVNSGGFRFQNGHGGAPARSMESGQPGVDETVATALAAATAARRQRQQLLQQEREDGEKLTQILRLVQDVHAQHARFQKDQEDRMRLMAEQEERNRQLLEQFLGLFGQATRMFLNLSSGATSAAANRSNNNALNGGGQGH